MNFNDILRRLRYALDLSDDQTTEHFLRSGYKITPEELAGFLARETDDSYIECKGIVLNKFLDGFVADRRGPRDPDFRAPKFTELTNNMILRKIRIALEFKEEDMLDICKAGGMPISRGELSALFRKPDDRRYKECGGQLLRKFLKGLTERQRGRS